MPPSSMGLPALELRDALVMRVRVGQGTGPLWAFLVVGAVVVITSVALYTLLTSATLLSTTSRAPTPSAAPPSKAPASSSPQAPSASPAAPPASATKTPLERAADGDETALKELEATPEAQRSVAQTLALAAGRRAVKRRAVAELSDRARHDDAFSASAELTEKLRSALADPDSVNEALSACAALPSTLGADLLYAFWTSHKKGDPAGELAHALLFTESVRKKASLSLSVALDLRRADSCDAAKDAVKRAVDQGDWRSTAALGRFLAKTGCGDNKKEDCWPCLRDDDSLKNALRAVVKRPAPKL